MSATHYLATTSILLASALGCGGSSDGDEFATLRGRIAPSTTTRIMDGSAHAAEVDTSLADAIWAIPVGTPRSSLAGKIALALEDDGSFSFTPDEPGTDYILALVDTSACTTTTPRNQWGDAEIDARTACILGYVSIPDAERSGSMVLIPTSEMTGDADLGEVTPSASASDEAGATQTLQDLAPSFAIGLDGLQDLARIDNALKAVIWSYANMSDDGSEWYELAAGYNFFAPNTLEAAVGGETEAADMRPDGWGIFWGTSVEMTSLQSNLATPGYLEFVAPHRVDDKLGFRHFKAGEAMGTDFIFGGQESDRIAGYSNALVGAADGIWEIHREGSLVSKFDMRTSAPFDTKDGILNLSYMTSYVPTLELETDAGGAITAVLVRFKTWDGSNYVDADAARAFNRFGGMGVSLYSDISGGCNGHIEFDSDWDSVESDHLRYDVKEAWEMGAGDESSCGLQIVDVNYKIFGAEYRYAWHQSYEPFDIARRSTSYLGLDPANGVDGTYVSFAAQAEPRALEWDDADVWFQLSDIVTTPVAGLVSLGTGEDGVFHQRAQAGGPPSFYLEYTGAGDPPANFETSATLTVHDGRPGRSKRSREYPVTWSNSAAGPSATVSVTSYAELPTAFVPHAATHEFRANGTMVGVNQGDHFAFSPASVAGWPADEYELVAARVLLLDVGTLDLATPPCVEPTCTADAVTTADGLGFYAPEAGDFDYQAFYTMRWTGAGSTPTLSSMVFNLGTSLLHALSSDNATAPALLSTTPIAQLLLSVSPSQLSIADAPLRVEYSANIALASSDTFYGDTVSITLPEGATVIPRTSTWSITGVAGFEDSLPEPTAVGQNYEWPFGTPIPIGAEAVLKFEVLLAPTATEQFATGQAWVGNSSVDLTATLGDDALANATVTVSP